MTDHGCSKDTTYRTSVGVETTTTYQGELPEVLRRIAAEIEAEAVTIDASFGSSDQTYHHEVRIRKGFNSLHWSVRQRYSDPARKPVEPSQVTYRAEHPDWCYE